MDKTEVIISLADFKRDKLNARCALCLAGRPACTVVALGEHCFVAVAPRRAIVPLSVVVCPYAHRTSTLQCTQDEVREMRAFIAALRAMYDYVIFSEVVDGSGRHAAVLATPLPSRLSALAPAYIRQALLELDGRVITTDRGPWGHIAPADALYTHFWLPEGGMAAVVPAEAHFDRQVLGGMLKLDPLELRQSPTYYYKEPTTELDEQWKKVDFTSVARR